MNQIKITVFNLKNYFYLEPLSLQSKLQSFKSSIDEYTDYLLNDAKRSLNDHIAKTWILSEKKTGNIAAYMSIIADAIKLSFAEKELHGLKYPFKTIPAMKIAKLAVDVTFAQKYKGLGTIMILAAQDIAYNLDNDYCEPLVFSPWMLT